MITNSCRIFTQTITKKTCYLVLKMENVETYDLGSFLCSQQKDFLIRNNGEQVKVTSLSGRIVGLYFSAYWCRASLRFMPYLVKAYNELKRNGNFEIVFISGDSNAELFNTYFSKMPWLATPFIEEGHDKVSDWFCIQETPHLVILDENGKLLTDRGVQIIHEYGAEGYPFVPEHFEKLKKFEEEAKQNQSLKSLLVSQTREYVISCDGRKVPVSSLVGKNVLLYFSAQWCPPCRTFLPILVQAYNEINEKNNNSLEVIFLSSDRDQSSFNEFFAKMPWLAFPFGDDTQKSLSCRFKVHRIPAVVAIGPTGETVTTEAVKLIASHGAKAYPFTYERVKDIKAEIEKTVKSWPKKVTDKGHVHELDLTKRIVYHCDGCNEKGQNWSYYCEECDYDLHPKCALGNPTKAEESEGWICNGDTCYKSYVSDWVDVEYIY